MATGSMAWLPELDALLARCASAFETGDFASAAGAWGRLLPALLLPDAYGGSPDPVELLSHPPERAIARWCRAILALEPAVQRGSRVVTALQRTCPLSEPVDLLAIRQAHRTPPEGWQRLLPRIRLALLQADVAHPAWPGLCSRLLAQLPKSDAELENMGRIAHTRRAPLLYLSWASGLELAGRLEDARAAVQAGLADAEPAWQARLLTRSAHIEQQLGRPHLDSLRGAWRAEGSTCRLARWAAALPAEERSTALEAEQTAVWERQPAVDQGALTLLELLRGEHEVAVARLEGALPEAWADRDHPGPLVLPVLLRMSLGVHPLPDLGPLAACWTQLAVGPDEDGEVRLAPLLDATLDAMPSWRHDAPWFRAHARRAVIDRVGAVLEAKERESYDEIAALSGAWLQATDAVGESTEAARFARELKSRWPRHRAFHTALAAVIGEP